MRKNLILIISFIFTFSKIIIAKGEDSKVSNFFPGIDTKPSFKECMKAITKGKEVPGRKGSSSNAHYIYSDRIYSVAMNEKGFKCVKTKKIK